MGKPVLLPLIGPRQNILGGHAMIDAEDEELVKTLGPWYRAQMLYCGQLRPAARNRLEQKGNPLCAWTWLHNFIVGLNDKHTNPNTDLEVCPVNDWWLDCQKDNLQIQPVQIMDSVLYSSQSVDISLVSGEIVKIDAEDEELVRLLGPWHIKGPKQGPGYVYTVGPIEMGDSNDSSAHKSQAANSKMYLHDLIMGSHAPGPPLLWEDSLPARCLCL